MRASPGRGPGPGEPTAPNSRPQARRMGESFHGFGPADAPVAIVERATHRAVRRLLPEMVVVVAGDLAADELLHMAESVTP